MIKQQVRKAIETQIMFIIIGVVPGISATTGANMVALRAITLQNPKADATNIVGISLTVAMKQILNADDTPNFETEMKMGINSC